MASEEPGPGRKYAILARNHIAALRSARPGITIEIRWCPAPKGVPGNEKAAEWAKLAAENPDARGVEPLPRSLAYLKGEISEEIGGSPPVGWKPNFQDKVQVAGQAATRRTGRGQLQEERLKVLPAEDRLLPHRAVPEPDKEPPHPSVLVVPVQVTDETNRRSCGRRPGRKRGDGKAAGRSETYWRTRDAAGRYLTPAPPRM
jgi:hypothetical protein